MERAGSLTLRTLGDPPGGDASVVRDRVATWLAGHPGGELPGAGDAAGEAVATLADAWNSATLHALAAGPRTAAELEGDLEGAERTAIERRLEAMQRLEMLERLPGAHGEAVYAVTDWLREGIGPLAAAARRERRHPASGAAQIEALDVAAAFQLALPLLCLPAECSGTCRLAVEVDGGAAGATARLEEGRAIACEAGLRPDADASCTGDVPAWFKAVVDGAARQLETDGDRELALAVLEGLHGRLFGAG